MHLIFFPLFTFRRITIYIYICTFLLQTIKIHYVTIRPLCAVRILRDIYLLVQTQRTQDCIIYYIQFLLVHPIIVGLYRRVIRRLQILPTYQHGNPGHGPRLQTGGHIIRLPAHRPSRAIFLLCQRHPFSLPIHQETRFCHHHGGGISHDGLNTRFSQSKHV